MKTILFKFVIIALLLPSFILANKGFNGKHTKEKKINKEFNVNAEALLKVKNSYGNLYITSWNENRVVIEVHIKTNGNNEEKVQERLDEIDVEFEADPGMVYAKTIFEKKKWGWNWGRNNNVNIKVNYTIKVPVTNRVDLSNDYGGINLDKLQGSAKISCDYGKLNIGELLSDNNILSFDYTSGSSIEYMKSGEIRADYSGFEIEKAGNLILNADYTTSRIKDVNTLSYNCDYGSVIIDHAKNVKGRADYLTVKLGKMSGNVDLGSTYGSIRIAELSKDAGNVKIRSEYTGIKIGYHQDYSFDFTIRLEYAGLKSEGLDFKIKKTDNNDKYYEGFHSTAGSGKQMQIDSEYGSVHLYKV
ncbi:hypothetical protein [Ascidiimonas aurantiaca]|uniref:hypothetical protein n=1 Tax=Ascidiimonas aurantiaca TaxID=1685432 RepID=UPI0030EED7BD